MKLLIVLLSLSAFVAAENIPEYNTAYRYHEKIGVPLANKIREQEEQSAKNPLSRIFNGSAASLGQFPYQAGLLASTSQGQSACGGVLVRNNRVLTAAHCWFDGGTQAWSFNVILGSLPLFGNSGTRINNVNNVQMHASWNPWTIANDIAIIRLPSSVNLSNNINVIALPSGSQLNDNFNNEVATASGYGAIANGVPISTSQSLRFGQMTVITNNVCQNTFGIVQSSNICVSTAGQASTCPGDSGGPLAVQRNGAPLLIGLTSFGAHPNSGGCSAGHPVAFVRVTSFMSWINQNL